MNAEDRDPITSLSDRDDGLGGGLREYLRRLSESGGLDRLGAPIEVGYDLAAVLSATETGNPIVIENAGGNRVLGNLLTNREQIARALGLGIDAGSGRGIDERLLGAIAAPIEPVVLEGGACREVRESEVRLDRLPFPRFFEQETGAYITAGIILVTDVLTGERNMSYARFKVLGPDVAMLGVSPNHHLGRMARRAAEAGRTLPIAVVLGVHPALTLAACLYLGFGDDELAVAGALLDGPVRTVLSRDGGIRIPADAELVLEGEVFPDELVREGLVSEFHGRYHDYGTGIITRFHTVTHRPDPIVPVVVPGLHREHLLLASVPIAAGLTAALRRIDSGVVQVAVPDSGAGRTSAVVAVRDIQPGRARQLMLACWSAVPLIKQVVVVDAEIDPWNAEAVEWARLSHARPERDFLILEGMRTDRSDPLVRDFTVGKLGVDATAKPGERGEGWAFARVPAASREHAARLLREAGISPAPSPVNAGISYGLD